MNGQIVTLTAIQYNQKDDKHTFAFGDKCGKLVVKFNNGDIVFPSLFVDHNDVREASKSLYYPIIEEKIKTYVGDFNKDDFTFTCKISKVTDGVISPYKECPFWL
jgi:hypothetical protein